MKVTKHKIKKLVPGGKNIMREVDARAHRCFVRVFVLGNTSFLSCKYRDFQKRIPGLSKFNATGDFFFYCLGDRGDASVWGDRQHVIEYGLKQERAITSHRCGLKLGKDDDSIALVHLISFPGLLKAIFDSRVDACIENFAKIYDLSDAIIPDNYPQCVPFVPSKYSYISFYTLPRDLMEAIRKRYNRQMGIGKK